MSGVLRRAKDSDRIGRLGAILPRHLIDLVCHPERPEGGDQEQDTHEPKQKAKQGMVATSSLSEAWHRSVTLVCRDAQQQAKHVVQSPALRVHAPVSQGIFQAASQRDSLAKTKCETHTIAIEWMSLTVNHMNLGRSCEAWRVVGFLCCGGGWPRVGAIGRESCRYCE
jgi:hypothetical protein